MRGGLLFQVKWLESIWSHIERMTIDDRSLFIAILQNRHFPNHVLMNEAHWRIEVSRVGKCLVAILDKLAAIHVQVFWRRAKHDWYCFLLQRMKFETVDSICLCLHNQSRTAIQTPRTCCGWHFFGVPYRPFPSSNLCCRFLAQIAREANEKGSFGRIRRAET